MQNSEEKKFEYCQPFFHEWHQTARSWWYLLWDTETTRVVLLKRYMMKRYMKIPKYLFQFQYFQNTITNLWPNHYQYSRNDLWLTRVLEDQWKKWKEVGIPITPTKCPLKGCWQRLFCNRNFGNTKHTLQLIIVEVAMPFLPKTINVANMKWQHLRWRWVW